MKDSLKFKGSKLIVQEAADPSTILWENLRVGLLSFSSMIASSIEKLIVVKEDSLLPL